MRRTTARSRRATTAGISESTFWINHEGRIVDREVGFDPETFSKMEGHVERLLAAKKKAAGAGG